MLGASANSNDRRLIRRFLAGLLLAIILGTTAHHHCSIAFVFARGNRRLQHLFRFDPAMIADR
jgi:hypothetical protein